MNWCIASSLIALAVGLLLGMNWLRSENDQSRGRGISSANGQGSARNAAVRDTGAETKTPSADQAESDAGPTRAELLQRMKKRHAGNAQPLANEVEELDPTNEEDRARLVQIVRDGSAARSIGGRETDRYAAARKLVKAGHVDPLIEILETTNTYNAMTVICYSVGGRSVPVMERRLADDPDNPYLVGSLSPVSDVRVTQLALRALGSSDFRTVHSAASKLIFAADIEGLTAALRSHFGAATDGWARKILAMCLLRRGDATPIPWIRQNMTVAVDSLHRLASSNRGFPFDDASVVAPLLPDLIELLGTNQTTAAYNTLVKLTRHNFGKTREPWRIWYDRHLDRPLVYTEALDRRIKKCAETFRDAVHGMGHRWCRTRTGPWERGQYRWRVANPPPKAVSISLGQTWKDGTPIKQPRFRIEFLISLQTTPSKLPGSQLEIKFDELNLVARLRLGKKATSKERGEVIAAAREACEALR